MGSIEYCFDEEEAVRGLLSLLLLMMVMLPAVDAAVAAIGLVFGVDGGERGPCRLSIIECMLTHLERRHPPIHR